MKLDNAKEQMQKGVLEYCILLVLEKKPLYVSDIVQSLEKSKIVVVEGLVYPKLIRMKNDGYLSCGWENSLGGTARKYYQLTEYGSQLLNALKRSWNEMATAVKLASQSD